MKGSVSPAPANIRTASSTTQVTLASTLSVAAAPKTVARPVSGYAVRPGDTLSGIAARFAVRGGWPALYAANRPRVGPDPDVIRPGTVLALPGRRAPARYTVVSGDTLAGIAAALAVRGGWPALYAANRPLIGSDPNVIRPGTVLVLPGRRAPARYTVVSGDTLAGIAAALAVRGGWPALYAANRHVIGPDPDVIRPGAVLTVPRAVAPSPAASRPAPRGYPVPPPSAPAGSGSSP